MKKFFGFLAILITHTAFLIPNCFAAELQFRWETEVSDALPYNANAFQGETFTLDVGLRQYGQDLTGDAAATFYYQTKEMTADQWYSVVAQWDATNGRASVEFTPSMDCGASAYRFFFGIETTQGKNYRAYGTLRMKPSPGFNPAQLEAPDVYAEIIADILQDVFAQTDAKYAAFGHNHDGTYLKSYTETDPLWSAAKPTIEANLTSLQEAIDNIDPVISWTDVKDKPETFTPSEHTHSQYLTAYTETDPTISAWAKALTKPTYTYAEITDTPTTWAWSALTGVPTTFTPAEHNHDSTYLKLSGGTATGTIAAPILNATTYFVTPKLVNEASNPYNHALNLGYYNHDYWEFLEYGGDFRFYKSTGANARTLVAQITTAGIYEGSTLLANKYAAKTHTHSDLNASIATLQAEAATHAPLSSVTMTESDTTYIWQWDDDAQTFALVTQE